MPRDVVILFAKCGVSDARMIWFKPRGNWKGRYLVWIARQTPASALSSLKWVFACTKKFDYAQKAL